VNLEIFESIYVSIVLVVLVIFDIQEVDVLARVAGIVDIRVFR